MPKKMPATIVKELRAITEYWDESDPVRNRVRGLVDQLPSFRAAPQTRVENTLRAVEAVLRSNLNIDPTVKPITETTRMRAGASTDLPMVTLLGIARIINIHHKVGQKALTKSKTLEEGPSDQDPTFHALPDACTGYYDSTFMLVHQVDCPIHGVMPSVMPPEHGLMVANKIAADKVEKLKKAKAAKTLSKPLPVTLHPPLPDPPPKEEVPF